MKVTSQTWVAHRLTPTSCRKDLTQVDFAALLADPAAVGDGPDPIVEREGEPGQAGVRLSKREWVEQSPGRSVSVNRETALMLPYRPSDLRQPERR